MANHIRVPARAGVSSGWRQSLKLRLRRDEEGEQAFVSEHVQQAGENIKRHLPLLGRRLFHIRREGVSFVKVDEDTE